MVFKFQQKGFFSAALDYFYEIFFPRENDCPINEANLARVKTIYITRFVPPEQPKWTSVVPATCDLFRTTFTPIDPTTEDLDSSLPATNFTPTLCPRGKTFITGFYPDEWTMPSRRGQSKSCTKEPYFNAVGCADGGVPSSGIVRTLKNWYCGREVAPPVPPIVDEPDDADCSCISTNPLLSTLLQLQRALVCSPLARSLLALAVARGALYVMGVRVCFVKAY